MPIIKSSESGDHITTIIFNSSEIAALAHLLDSAKFPKDATTRAALHTLGELAYGLGIEFEAFSK
jgi:hypothetical protein